MATRKDFFLAVLKDLDPKYVRIGIRRVRRVTFMLQWSLAESGYNACNGQSGAKFNPLNTTTASGITTNYNSVGVKNEPTFGNGVAATVATLKNGHYANILGELKWATSTTKMAQAVASSPWGTGAGVLNVQKSWTIFKRRQVAALKVG